MESVPDILAALLKPHMAELQCVINPGLVTLTWTSMNIQAYLQRFHAEMVRFGELVDKLKDNVANRLVRNQNVIKICLWSRCPRRAPTLSLDKFVAMQEKFATEQTAVMFAKNIEVEAAMRDLVRRSPSTSSYVPQQSRPAGHRRPSRALLEDDVPRGARLHARLARVLKRRVSRARWPTSCSSTRRSSKSTSR